MLCDDKGLSHEEIKNMWFQQDGASPHWALAVRAKLTQMFKEKWIGREGPIAWPARSPDLSKLDSFFWGFMKERIYLTPSNNFNELRYRIQEAADAVTPEMLERVNENFIKRCRACIQANGGKFEHVLRR